MFASLCGAAQSENAAGGSLGGGTAPGREGNDAHGAHTQSRAPAVAMCRHSVKAFVHDGNKLIVTAAGTRAERPRASLDSPVGGRRCRTRAG
jgi:hypothetical protein